MLISDLQVKGKITENAKRDKVDFSRHTLHD
jgi:hypothetical protein